MRSAERKGWERAIIEELQALEDNGVWRISKRPKGRNTLHTKWVYRTKTNVDGHLECLKARLVTCGNEQVFGVDYQLTFAAVMDMSTVKVILALSAIWGVPAKHGDIPNAYVKAEKESHLEILVHIPQAMEVSEETLKTIGATNKKEVLLELHKILYGLKQAGRIRSQLLNTRLLDAGFTQCQSDICLY